MRLKWRLVIPLLTVSCVATYLTTRVLQSQPASPWIPHTLVFEETVTHLPAGKSVRGRIQYSAVRSDGSRAEGDARPSSDPAYTGVRQVLSLAAKRKVLLDDVLRARTTHLLRSEVIAARSIPPHPTSCAVNRSAAGVIHELGGEQEVLGWRSVVVTLKYDDVIQTHWLVPDLNCASVRFVEERFSGSGEVSDLFERAAISIRLGEPEEQLFETPAEYEEMPPSEMRVRRAAHEGRKPAPMTATLQRANDVYFASIARARNDGSNVPAEMLKLLDERPAR